MVNNHSVANFCYINFLFFIIDYYLQFGKRGDEKGSGYNPWMGKRSPMSFGFNEDDSGNFSRLRRRYHFAGKGGKRSQYAWSRMRKNQYQWGHL